jgi:hypothetical protein
MEKRRHERARESFAVISDEEKACIVCVYIKASRSRPGIVEDRMKA